MYKAKKATKNSKMKKKILGYNMDCEPLYNWDYLTLTNFLTITNHNFANPEK